MHHKLTLLCGIGAYPVVLVFAAAVDAKLDAEGFIMPGLAAPETGSAAQSTA